MRSTHPPQSIYGLTDSIAFCEAQGLAVCFQTYADECAGETISDGGIGFNSHSGYVYIALENGVTICSMFGSSAEFLVTNFEDGEETFFDTYAEALKHYETINN